MRAALKYDQLTERAAAYYGVHPAYLPARKLKEFEAMEKAEKEKAAKVADRKYNLAEAIAKKKGLQPADCLTEATEQIRRGQKKESEQNRVSATGQPSKADLAAIEFDEYVEKTHKENPGMSWGEAYHKAEVKYPSHAINQY